MLTYALGQRGELSLYEYLYSCIRADIEQGRIEAGEKLPSKRALARHLGVSLITIEGAYTQLIAEGYVRSEPRRGYYACDLGKESALPAAGRAADSGPLSHVEPSVLSSQASRSAVDLPASFAPSISASFPSAGQPFPVTSSRAGQPFQVSSSSLAELPPQASRSSAERPASRAQAATLPGVASRLKGVPDTAAPQISVDLAGGTIPVGLFPYGAWAKSVREALSCEPEQSLLGEGSAAGMLHLRQTIARYLKEFRGMEVDPACIVIGAGSQVLYNLLVQLLGRDKTYGIEDPGYPRLTSIYQANNVPLVHLPLDGSGVCLSSLYDANVEVVHLMPSHQFPCGLVTSISRRYELLGWAASAPDRYIIEDDYDCEFRLTGKPIPSLQSIDASERVIYANTFTKSLGPAFRIGYMVLPEALAQRFHQNLGFYSSTVSAIDQLALARFIDDGNYERHVNRMRTFYRTTRNQLIAALRGSEVLARCRIEAQDSGIHFVLDATAIMREQGQGDAKVWSAEVCKKAEQGGVRLCTIASYYRGIAVPTGAYCRYLINYSGLSQSAIPFVVHALEQAFCTTPQSDETILA